MGSMNAAEIIEKLGDTAVVADELKLNLPVVSNWKLRGIPPSRWLDIRQLAERKGMTAEITPEVIRASEGAKRHPIPATIAP